ncbi:helix-turn-helix transcriptional regulator [Streptomyces zhihengii]
MPSTRNVPAPPQGLAWAQDWVSPDGKTRIPGIATRLGITYNTYRKWRMRGEGPPAIKVGNKRVAASIRAIEKWLADQEQAVIDEAERAAGIARHDMRPAELRSAA